MTRVHINIFSLKANTTVRLMSHSVFTALEMIRWWYVNTTSEQLVKITSLQFSESEYCNTLYSQINFLSFHSIALGPQQYLNVLTVVFYLTWWAHQETGCYIWFGHISFPRTYSEPLIEMTSYISNEWFLYIVLYHDISRKTNPSSFFLNHNEWPQ